MRYKMLAAGILFIFSSACLSHNDTFSKKTDLSDAPKEESAVSRTISEDQNQKTSEPSIGEKDADGFSLEILSQDQYKPGAEFDIPIVINAKVEQFILYFQTTGRKIFAGWLSRSERYIPAMRIVLKENGLPEDLVYLALIESGFNPYAFSRKKAAGPWQFIYLTGKRYGLKSNWWIDERRDPEKSTVAAAKYLKDLYDRFDCWYLAAAGYNAGEGKIMRAMKRYRTEDYWELTKSKYRYLRRETKNYVPQMIAAALIAKEPNKYGFSGIEYQEPLRYEKVKVPEVTDLRCVAQACEVSLEEIRGLNPELSRWCTPPEFPEYEIKIPPGKKDLFTKNFENLCPAEQFKFKTYTIKRGDTVSKIARRFQVAQEPILELNHLTKRSHLSKGRELIIPLPLDEAPKQEVNAESVSTGISQNSKPTEIIYTIKKGDTLWSIAAETGVNIGALTRLNHINPEKKLLPGNKLKIRIAESSDEG